MNGYKPNSLSVDKRYIAVLPDVWGEEAERIGGELPFLYDIDKRAWLHVSCDEDDMEKKVKDFLGADYPEPEPQKS